MAQNKMDFYEVINKRRTIRQFEQEEIPNEVLERIINAGLKAPSGDGGKDCELIIITEKDTILDLAKFINSYPYKKKTKNSSTRDV